MAFVADPGGAPVGVWQPALHRGIGVLGETGAPSWFELHTRDYEGSLAFLRDVFGWDTRTVSEAPARYTVLEADGEPHAGVMDARALLAEGTPPSWSVYFGVDDTDAALAQVVDLGGAVVLPAEDTAVRATGGGCGPHRRDLQARGAERPDARPLTRCGAPAA